MGGQQSTQAVRSNEKKPLVVVEGNIGAGKTRLCTEAALNGWNVLSEYVNKKLLKLFYEDSKRYAFTMQMSMIQRRLYHTKLHAQMMKYGDFKGSGNIADRSPLGDWMFALCNFLLGNMTTSEMEAYEAEVKTTADKLADFWFLNQVSAIVFLDDSSEGCKRRVECVRKNAEELKIPLYYYECIDDAYFYMIRCILSNEDLRSKLFVFRWGQYDEWQAVEAVVQQQSKPTQVHDNTTCLIYENEDIIKRDYERYCLDKESIDHNLHVVFKDDIMDRTDVSDYLHYDSNDKKLTSYHKLVWRKQNAYKRLVMLYLSEGRHVSFE